MRLKDLTAEFNTTNKELIAFYKENGYPSVTSHMTTLTDEMVEFANEHFQPSSNDKVEEKVEEKPTKTVKSEYRMSFKKFNPDDRIPCKSVTPWSISVVGSDRRTPYHWEYFGDVEYVKYADLEYFRRRKLITAPKVIIMDEDICEQWKKDLGHAYDIFKAIEYPEDFFEYPDDEFERILRTCSDNVKDVIKTTAMVMVRNENYPSLKKIKMIDDILGTCIKDFI